MSKRADAAAPVPAVVIRLELEASAVVLDIVGCDSPAIAERLGAWIGVDPARRSLLASALSLLPRRPGDLADDKARVLVSAAFGTASDANPSADPFDAVATAGSFEATILRRSLALGWAAAQPRRLDPRFRAAVLKVARREAEGLLEAPDVSAADDPPADQHDDEAGPS